MKELIIPALVLWLIICGFALGYENWILPKWIFYSIILGAGITFFFIPISTLTNRILDIPHPVYTDGGMSTLSMIICLLGGVLLAGTLAIIYRLIRKIKIKLKHKKERR